MLSLWERLSIVAARYLSRVRFNPAITHGIALAVLSGFLSGCDQIPTDDGEYDSISAFSSVCSATGSFKNFTHDALYSCGAVVRVQVESGSPSILGDAVDAAIVGWNNALESPTGEALPQFERVYTGTYDLLVEYDSIDGVNKFCGSGTSSQINIYSYASGTSNCVGHSSARRVTDLNGVVLHEMGHALGFSHFSTADSAVAGCAMHVPATGDQLNNICAHEKQILYYVFGLRRDASGSLVGVDLNHAMVTGMGVAPAGWTADSGDIQQFTRVWYAGDSENLLPVPFPPARPKATATISPAGVVSFVSAYSATDTSYSVEAQAPGTAALIVTLQLDSTVIWPAPLDSVAIVVNGPPPPAVIEEVDAQPWPVYLAKPGSKLYPLSRVVTGTAEDTNDDVVVGATFDWWVDDTSIAYISGDATDVSSIVITAVTSSKQRTTLRFESVNGVQGAVSVWVNCDSPGGCE